MEHLGGAAVESDLRARHELSLVFGWLSGCQLPWRSCLVVHFRRLLYRLMVTSVELIVTVFTRRLLPPLNDRGRSVA